MELVEGGPRFEFEETYEPLAKSSYFTKPRPEQPYSPIKNLFASIINFNQSTSSILSLSLNLPMAQKNST
jgi:hypothetical protein